MAATRAPALVGREDVQQRLAVLLAAARAGSPASLVVLGEAGIGKTRLLDDWAADHLREPDIILTGHAVALSGDQMPFGAVRNTLRDLIRRQGLDLARTWAGPSVDVLAGLVPELTDTAPRDPERVEIIDAFAGLLFRLAAQSMTVWRVEDLQWADSQSRDTLAYVCRLLAAPSQLLVASTARTRDAPPASDFNAFLAELVRIPACHQINLERLTAETVALLVESLLESQPPRTLTKRVTTLSEGIPYLVEELVACGVDHEGPLPDTIRSLVLARIEGLSAQATTVVRAASVVPGEINDELLSEVTGLADGQTAAAIEDAVGAGVLEVSSSGEGLMFRHALLRESLVASLLPTERRDWHRSWAETIEQRSDRADPQHAVSASYHWSQTDESERAFDATARAARWAERVGATREQVILLTRLLELWPRATSPEKQAGHGRDDLLGELILAHNMNGSRQAALDLMDKELARPDHGDGDAVPRRMFLEGLRALFRTIRGLPVDRRIPSVAERIEKLTNAPRTRWFARAVYSLASDVSTKAEADLVDPLMTEAEELLARRWTPHERVMFANSRVEMLAGAGDLDAAVELELELLPEIRSQNSTGLVLLWQSNTVADLSKVGRFREAAELGRLTLRQLCSPLLAPGDWALVSGNLAEALIELGEWDEARELFERSAFMDTDELVDMVFRLQAGMIDARRGHLDSARERLAHERVAMPPSAESNNPELLFVATALAAEIALQAGEATAASTVLETAWRNESARAWLVQRREEALVWRVVLLAARAETEGAGRARSRRSRHRSDAVRSDTRTALQEVAAELPTPGVLGEAWIAQFAAGQASWTGKDSTDAWQHAADCWNATGQVHDEAWALVRFADTSLSAGDRDRAADALTCAVETAERLQARPLRDAAHRVAARGRIVLPGDGEVGSSERTTYGLTAREREVLELLAEGLKDDEIAGTLYISPRTASVHVSHVLAKLGVATRGEAAARAHREGLLPLK